MSEKTKAIPTEMDITRPAGPLEEGDQLLMDAVDRIGKGVYVPDHKYAPKRKPWVKIVKTFDNFVEYASISEPNGMLKQPTEQTAAGGDSRLAVGGGKDTEISAHIGDNSQPQERGTIRHAFNEVVEGNKVIDDPNANNILDREKRLDRQEAQAIKKEAAHRIDRAREMLGEMGVDATVSNAEELHLKAVQEGRAIDTRGLAGKS